MPHNSNPMNPDKLRDPAPIGLPTLDSPDKVPHKYSHRRYGPHKTPPKFRKPIGTDEHSGKSPKNILTVQQACQSSQKDRLSYLMGFNQMTEPVVIGTVSLPHPDQTWPRYWIRNLHTVEGKPIILPVESNRRSLSVPITSPAQPKLTSGSTVQLEINVVPNNSPEIRRNNKPFSLEPVGEAEVVLPLTHEAKDENGRILIRESIRKSIQNDLDHEFAQQRQEQEKAIYAEIAKCKKESERLSQLIDAAESANSEWKKAEERLAHTIQAISSAQLEYTDIVKHKEILMSAYKHLLDFVKERSDLLLSLDLITPEQQSTLCGTDSEHKMDEAHHSWIDDLHTDYSKLVSSIHAYLLSTGIIYPRWLVANFLTLLRTNDLIILSGLSGSGKTQIVRSFANALGGKAHIMPVKPNWTGAEDLLGFFNPLQRSYVRTPFLEALLEAQKDPHRLHLICLDEMNLARAEYYFADFLSAQEDRKQPAMIPLNSEHEANKIQSEVRMLLAALHGDELLKGSAERAIGGFDLIFNDPNVMARIREMFGENAAESLPAFHGRVRKALSTVLDIPTKITVPDNVRFIGAINVDQTTYGLSPKILDRAHVLRFENPLNYSVSEIENNVSQHMEDVPNQRPAPIYMPPDAFYPQRDDYPKFDASHPAAKLLIKWQKEYLTPLGMDVAYRTIRQAQLYWDLLKEVFPADNHEAVAKNLLVLQKILPKFTVDGKVKAKFGDSQTLKDRFDIAGTMESALGKEEATSPSNIHPNAAEEIHRIRMAAEANDKIFNYWA